jgi:hypothetical protein
MKGWKKISQANGAQKEARVAILKSEKAHFKPKLIRRDKEVHLILIKGIIHTECWCTQFHKGNSTGHKSIQRL